MITDRKTEVCGEERASLSLFIRAVESESESVKMYRLRPQSKILTRYFSSKALIAAGTIRLILKYRL
jgi:hypothetical protein